VPLRYRSLKTEQCASIVVGSCLQRRRRVETDDGVDGSTRVEQRFDLRCCREAALEVEHNTGLQGPAKLFLRSVESRAVLGARRRDLGAPKE